MGRPIRRFQKLLKWALFLLPTLTIIVLLCTMMGTYEWVVLHSRIRGPLPADDPKVLALLKTSYIHPPSTLPYNLNTYPAFIKFKYVGTWDFIYNNTKKLFGDIKGGFFVEAGALDGEKESNTFWLERDLGWTGLLVEPNPHSYGKLISKHRKSWSSNTCLSPHAYPIELVLISVARKTHNDFSIFQEALSFRGLSYLQGYGFSNDGIFRDLMQRSDESYVMTQCFPLASYLLALNVTTVDFLSLDIQNAEKGVLENLLTRADLTIRVIIVEVVEWDIFNKDFRPLMKNSNYTLIAEGKWDYVFVKNNDSLLKQFYTETNTENKTSE